MSTILIAHTGHWAVQVAYFLPVLIFLAWLGWTTLKERRAGRGAGPAEAREGER
jgi:membrane protein implicated in regulation of membrane protease activity